jgi:hypothetical protein
VRPADRVIADMQKQPSPAERAQQFKSRNSLDRHSLLAVQGPIPSDRLGPALREIGEHC